MKLLGYEFRNVALAEAALTTPSCRMDSPKIRDNQRLEFLGDAVLGFVIAERLYGAFPNDQEGPLTVRRTRMVSAMALCEAVRELDFVGQLRQSNHAAALVWNSKTIADAVEAVIGAAYVDGGLAAACQVIDALQLKVEGDGGEDWRANPKGELQIRAQAMTPPRHPEYSLVRIEGKAHAPTFTVKVVVNGVGEAVGTAGTRKDAESHAAAELLSKCFLKSDTPV